jgi:hypothetical protein
MIPTTVPAAIMPIEFSAGAIELSAGTVDLGARTIITVAVVIPVATYVNAEPFSACYRWHCDGSRGQRGQCQLSHVWSPSLRTEENEHRYDMLQGTGRNFFEYMFSIMASASVAVPLRRLATVEDLALFVGRQ